MSDELSTLKNILLGAAGVLIAFFVILLLTGKLAGFFGFLGNLGQGSYSSDFEVTQTYEERYGELIEVFKENNVPPTGWKACEFEALLVSIAVRESSLGYPGGTTKNSERLMGYGVENSANLGAENQVRGAANTLRRAINRDSSVYSKCDSKFGEQQTICILTTYGDPTVPNYAEEVLGIKTEWDDYICSGKKPDVVADDEPTRPREQPEDPVQDVEITDDVVEEKLDCYDNWELPSRKTGQAEKTSDQLCQLLVCLGEKHPGLEITSIIQDDLDDFSVCTRSGDSSVCVHEYQSCHYGGSCAPDAGNEAHAIDFAGCGSNKAQIIADATACGAWVNDECNFGAPHLHMDTRRMNGGCLRDSTSCPSNLG